MVKRVNAPDVILSGGIRVQDSVSCTEPVDGRIEFGACYSRCEVSSNG